MSAVKVKMYKSGRVRIGVKVPKEYGLLLCNDCEFLYQRFVEIDVYELVDVREVDFYYYACKYMKNHLESCRKLSMCEK